MEHAGKREVDPAQATEGNALIAVSRIGAAIAAFGAILAGTVCLLGWILNVEVLKSLHPSWILMVPNTAVALILLGIAMLSGAFHLPLPIQRFVRICGLLAGIIGLLSLSQYVFGLNFGIDRLLIHPADTSAHTTFPGRPSPDASLCMMLVAVALELTYGIKRLLLAAATFGLLALGVALAALASQFGPALAPSAFWTLTIMAAPAAAAMALMGTAIAFSAWIHVGPQWAVHKWITLLFSVGLVVLILVGIVANRNLVRLDEADRQLRDDWQARLALARVSEVIQLVQASIQADLRSGDIGSPRFETESVRRARDQVRSLRLSGADPRLRHQLIELNDRLTSVTQWWEQTSEMRPAGDLRQAVQRLAEGGRLVQEAQSKVTQIEIAITESVRRNEQNEIYASGLTSRAVVGRTVVGFIAFFCVLVGLNRIALKRRETEQQLQHELALHQELSKLKETLLEPRTASAKLQLITETIVHAFGADFCRIWLIKPGDRCDRGCLHAQETEGSLRCRNREQCLHLVSSAGRYTNIDGIKRSRIPLGSCKVGQIASGKESKFLITDMLHDAPEVDRAWARDLGLVSFGGYRLQSPTGSPLGVLALFSQRPLTFQDDLLLEDLSATTSLVLMTHEAEEALRLSQSFLMETEKIAKVGGWELDLDSQRGQWTEEVFRIHEMEAVGRPGLQDGLNFYTPESRPVIAEAVREAIEDGKPYDLELNIITAKGNLRRVHTTGRIDPGRRRLHGIFQDVTERHQIEARIRESEIRFRRFMESQIIGVIIADTEGGIREANDLFLGMLGYSRQEFEANGLRWDDITPPEWAANDRLMTTEMKDLGVSTPREKEYLHKDGHRVPVLFGAAGFEALSGSVNAVCFILDLTERKRAEAELRETQAILAVAMDQSTAGIIVCSTPDGRIRYANRAAFLTSGADPEITMGRPHDEDYAGQWHLYDVEGNPLPNDQIPLVRAMRYGEHCSRELVFRQPGREDRLVSAHAAPIRDDQGTITGGVVVFPDITGRVRAEAKVIESEQKLQRAGAMAHIGHWVMDIRARSVGWSKEMYRIHGVRPAEYNLAFEWPLPMCHPDDQETLQAAMEHLLRGADSRFEYRIVRPDGTERHLTCLAEAQCDSAGETVAVFGALQDTTEAWQKARELQQKSAELERFTYTISHDLKSPLVTVKTFLGYLSRDLADGDTVRVEKDFHYIRTATDKMGRLLDELLQMSRVGRVSTPPARVGLKELIDETLAMLAGPIAERRAVVSISGTDLELWGDRPRLVEIWQNLLENSLKFMGTQAQPQIELGWEQQAGEIVFFVHDNGMGLDPVYAQKIFDLFEKLDANTEGTGLGLALVKRIVETYGGGIWCESMGVGCGCRFRFTLPKALLAGESGPR